MSDKTMWLAIRAALLQIVDAIERRYGMPRTAVLRKSNKPVMIGENDSVSGAL